MTAINTIVTANALMVQRFARSYLVPGQSPEIVTIEGASIAAKRVANRTSLPADAITHSYLVEHPELGFAFRFRAVWREGQLFRPTATHVVIEREWDEGNHGSSAAVSAAINEWLQAVTP